MQILIKLSAIFFMLTLNSFPFDGFCAETDKISSGVSYLKDPDTITSNSTIFKLGFFTPQNTTNRYLAIFHIFSPNDVLWIANRNKPLKDSSGKVFVSKHGNLVLTNGENETLWSTNITTTKFPTNVVAQIQDTGNLVLYENSTENVLWDSFSHPAHVWIPANKLVDNTKTGFSVRLSSWKNDSDPEVGDFTSGLDASRIPEIFIWKKERPYYRTGPWNGQIFIGMKMVYKTAYSNGLRVTEVSPGNFYVSTAQDRFFTKYTVHPWGSVEKTLWNDQNKSWDRMWSVPSNDCDFYGKCGAFGICNLDSPKLCSCLRGFVPVDKEEWDRGNWTSGCVRRTQLQYCNNNNNSTSGDNADGFLSMRFLKVPDLAESYPSSDLEECRIKCLSNCSCIAYAHDQSNIGCMLWWERDGLVDTQQFPGVGVDLYIRVAKSETDKAKERSRLLAIIIPVIIGGLVFISAIVFTAWWMMAKKKEGGSDRNSATEENSLSSPVDPIAMVLQDEDKSVQIEELTLFSFETLAKATKRFHEKNLLGKGGFGHVYKGVLSNGEEIAVKRLSEASRQGREEFMNEMIVISRLQHRNLVRLLGCCVEREEKMLVYEYMPNKSLDICLFGNACLSRDWKTRFNIIEGIGRGLLYLHKDSRLRIIHRDLKPSNVLLDEDWNPKISDFGMARIFESNQDQQNTAKVVGTYGYMAPEYAFQGKYSEKSDVYSFGVLMLEIISGKKNTHYKNQEWPTSILGYAWKLWNEGNGLDFADPKMASSEFEDDIVRCIQIALLCVQEFAKDRPAIQTVFWMLSREIVDMPIPEEPAFAEKFHHMDACSTDQIGYSINQLTVTVLHGR